MTLHHSFDNGLVLLAEPMPWTEAVSCSLLIPYGPVLDRPEQAGLASLRCEMSLRGAGDRDSRAFRAALENLGCETTETVGQLHTGYGVSLLGTHLLPALELVADQVRRPQFPAQQLESARQVLRQDIFSLEDDPVRRLMDELRRQFLPDPWGRSDAGTLETIDTLTLDDVRRCHARYIQPQGSILSVAGQFRWDDLRCQIDELFGDWQARPFELTEERIIGHPYTHIDYDSQQTHIGVAFPCEPLHSPDYWAAWSAVGVLSGGMSSRLFDELREKRGLCYSVHAGYSTLRDRAGVYCYCGTSTERAQESLDVLLQELNRLRDGIAANELRRLKIRARTALVMQQESTAARSSAMTRDWYHLDRIRTPQEMESAVESLSLDAVNAYWAEHPPGSFHIVTLGPERFLL